MQRTFKIQATAIQETKLVSVWWLSQLFETRQLLQFSGSKCKRIVKNLKLSTAISRLKRSTFATNFSGRDTRQIIGAAHNRHTWRVFVFLFLMTYLMISPYKEDVGFLSAKVDVLARDFHPQHTLSHSKSNVWHNISLATPFGLEDQQHHPRLSCSSHLNAFLKQFLSEIRLDQVDWVASFWKALPIGPWSLGILDVDVSNQGNLIVSCTNKSHVPLPKLPWSSMMILTSMAE